MVCKNRLVLRPVVVILDDRCLLSGLGVPSGYAPAQVKAAYGLGGLTFPTTNGQAFRADGTGQTIAIIVAYHDPNLASDLHVFDMAYGLPDPKFSQINLGDATNINNGWASEATLDVEWAHALAPGANILVVEAATDNTDDLINAVNVARNTPGVAVVSMSWGGPETSTETAYDSTFTTPAGHAGITFIAATGDNGAKGGAEWPAASPNVLAVGGTTLTINSAGGYGGESGWSSGGSGLSRYESEPAFQYRVQSSGRRSVPDVAFVADPATGVSVYATSPSDGSGGWQKVGGTSLGAPAWAGIVAIIDQGLALNGQGSLDGPSQTLPELYSLLSGNFHLVPNTTSTPSNGFQAKVAVISTVGLGTPNGQALLNAVVHPTVPIAQAISAGIPLAGGTTSAGGSPGGPTASTGGTDSISTYPGGWWPILDSGTTKTTKAKGLTGHTKHPAPITKSHAPKPVLKAKSPHTTNKHSKHASTPHSTQQAVQTAIVHSTGIAPSITSSIALTSHEELNTPNITVPAPLENAPAILEAFDRAIEELVNEFL